MLVPPGRARVNRNLSVFVQESSHSHPSTESMQGSLPAWRAQPHTGRHGRGPMGRGPRGTAPSPFSEPRWPAWCPGVGGRPCPVVAACACALVCMHVCTCMRLCVCTCVCVHMRAPGRTSRNCHKCTCGNLVTITTETRVVPSSRLLQLPGHGDRDRLARHAPWVPRRALASAGPP